MFEYRIGKKYPELANGMEGIVFDYSDCGAMIIQYMRNPSNTEIKDVQEGNIELKMVSFKDVIALPARFGSGPWCDMWYTPHLSLKLSSIDPDIIVPGEGQGILTTVLLVDSLTGEIKAMRTIAMSERFSRRFLKNALELAKKPFDYWKYNNSIGRIQAAYPSKKLASMSEISFRINRN